MSGEEFLGWVQKVETIFEYIQISDSKKVKLIDMKLSERPLLWWTQNKQMRQKMGKEPFTSRENMKRKL